MRFDPLNRSCIDLLVTSVAFCQTSHCQRAAAAATAATTMGTTIYLATRVNCRFLLSSVLADLEKHFFVFGIFALQIATEIAAVGNVAEKLIKKRKNRY